MDALLEPEKTGVSLITNHRRPEAMPRKEPGAPALDVPKILEGRGEVIRARSDAPPGPRTVRALAIRRIGRSLANRCAPDRELWRQCATVVDALQLPQPWDLTLFVHQLSERTGRPLRVMPTLQLEAGMPTGLLVSTARSDYILVPATTTRLHGDLIALHEAGHLILDPTSKDVNARVGAAKSGLGAEAERAAEIIATLILQRSQQPKPGKWPGRWLDHLRLWRTHRKLGSLWEAFHKAYPEHHLPVAPWNIRLRLLRRVIEIRDGLLDLSFYLPPEARQEIHRADLRDLRAPRPALPAARGSHLQSALSRKLTGVEPYRPVQGARTPAVEPLSLDHKGLDAEIAHLLRVAEAYASPARDRVI